MFPGHIAIVDVKCRTKIRHRSSKKELIDIFSVAGKTGRRFRYRDRKMFEKITAGHDKCKTGKTPFFFPAVYILPG